MGLFGKKAQAPERNYERTLLVRNLNGAEVRHLEVLRREIANLIVDSDPNLMIRCYNKAWAFEREMAANQERATAEEAAIVGKFPTFPDFDLLGTRHFVPYGEARDMWSDDDLVERYHEISRMLIFMRRRRDFGADVPVHDAKEEEILHACMQREKDRRFRARIEDAMRRFYVYRAGLEKGDPSALGVNNYVDSEVEIFHLFNSSLPDNEYAILFKKTDEFGVYSFHVIEDGKISYSYYRTDGAFKERQYLME